MPALSKAPSRQKRDNVLGVEPLEDRRVPSGLPLPLLPVSLPDVALVAPVEQVPLLSGSGQPAAAVDVTPTSPPVEQVPLLLDSALDSVVPAAGGSVAVALPGADPMSTGGQAGLTVPLSLAVDGAATALSLSTSSPVGLSLGASTGLASGEAGGQADPAPGDRTAVSLTLTLGSGPNGGVLATSGSSSTHGQGEGGTPPVGGNLPGDTSSLPDSHTIALRLDLHPTAGTGTGADVVRDGKGTGAGPGMATVASETTDPGRGRESPALAHPGTTPVVGTGPGRDVPALADPNQGLKEQNNGPGGEHGSPGVLPGGEEILPKSGILPGKGTQVVAFGEAPIPLSNGSGAEQQETPASPEPDLHPTAAERGRQENTVNTQTGAAPDTVAVSVTNPDRPPDGTHRGRPEEWAPSPPRQPGSAEPLKGSAPLAAEADDDVSPPIPAKEGLGLEAFNPEGVGPVTDFFPLNLFSREDMAPQFLDAWKYLSDVSGTGISSWLLALAAGAVAYELLKRPMQVALPEGDVSADWHRHPAL